MVIFRSFFIILGVFVLLFFALLIFPATGSAADMCGDVTGDGVVDGVDLTIYKRTFENLPPGMTRPDLCDVGGSVGCTEEDLEIMEKYFGGLATLSNQCTSKRSIEIKTPNGGEILTVGETYRITWDATENIDNINISSFVISSVQRAIASNISNIGYYDWTVNVGNTSNTEFKIKIIGYDTGYGSTSDESDAFFTVVNPSPVNPPNLTAIEPTVASFGQTITIRGTHLSLTSLFNTVYFRNKHTNSVYSGINATNHDGTYITFSLPESLSAGEYEVYVIGENGQSNKLNFTVDSDGPSALAPNINSSSPASAKWGEAMTLFGTNFKEGAYVEVLGPQQTISPSSLTPSSLSFIVPSNLAPGTYLIQIGEKASDVKSNKVFMTVTSTKTTTTPLITSIFPQTSVTGQHATIHGSGFNSNTIVEFVDRNRTVNAFSVDYNNLTFIVPAEFGLGSYAIRTIEKAGGPETTSNTFPLIIVSQPGDLIHPGTPTDKVTPPIPPPTSNLGTFTRNLWRGLRGDDVQRLQQLLGVEQTGYFGILTQSAVQNFQCKYNIVCGGIPDSTGYGIVGPLTLKKLNEVYGNTNETIPSFPSRSSGLSQSQIDAIISLLEAFGADASVIANVRATL